MARCGVSEPRYSGRRAWPTLILWPRTTFTLRLFSDILTQSWKVGTIGPRLFLQDPNLYLGISHTRFADLEIHRALRALMTVIIKKTINTNCSALKEARFTHAGNG